MDVEVNLEPALDEMFRLQHLDISPAQIPLVLSQLTAMQGALAVAQGALLSRIDAVPAQGNGGGAKAEQDRWLTSDEAAALLRVDRKWLYRRARSLPFCRRLSRKKLLFSEAGLHRWMATRTR